MKHVMLFEEFSANQVTCDNCGWQWRIEEGGMDPYVCHKCGHDNSPEISEASKVLNENKLNTLNDIYYALKHLYPNAEITKDRGQFWNIEKLNPDYITLYFSKNKYAIFGINSKSSWGDYKTAVLYINGDPSKGYEIEKIDSISKILLKHKIG